MEYELLRMHLFALGTLLVIVKELSHPVPILKIMFHFMHCVLSRPIRLKKYNGMVCVWRGVCVRVCIHVCMCKGRKKRGDHVFYLNQFLSYDYVFSSSIFCKVA